MSEALATKNLRKRFGGLHVTADVSFDVEEGEIHAIIGPNGAGKTTLLSQLAGSLQPDSGEIRFQGDDVTNFDMPRRVRAGIVRSFQITTLCNDLTVLEHAVLASQRVNGRSLRFWRDALADAQAVAAGNEALARVGLEGRRDAPVVWLSYGEQRQLEIALALACRPTVVLLDEPLAGLSLEESRRMIELIRRVRSNLSIVLIEHDMDAVFSLADRITVLDQGRVIASGDAEQVGSDEAVRKAYLGDDEIDYA